MRPPLEAALVPSKVSEVPSGAPHAMPSQTSSLERATASQA